MTRMTVRALLTSSAFLLLLTAYTSAEDQPTCKAIWLFNLQCSEAARALVNLVNAWSSQQECDDNQERCMYQTMNVTPTYLEFKHSSLSTFKTTKLAFGFNSPTAPFCKMRATSITSQNSTSPNDYCLLHNLITGSGLTHAPGYKEICRGSMCPPKATASCNTEG